MGRSMPNTKIVDVHDHFSNASQTPRVSADKNRRQKERQMRKIIAALQVSASESEDENIA
jgi:hypothetical protein